MADFDTDPQFDADARGVRQAQAGNMEALDLAALRISNRDSQAHGQKLRDFAPRAMEAEVQCYHVFLRGERVTYMVRQGDQHTEWFPGTGPSPTPKWPVAVRARCWGHLGGSARTGIRAVF